MAIATPVLEKKVRFTENGKLQVGTYRSSTMTQDECHNARIRDNYQRLINPDYSIHDVFNGMRQEDTVQPLMQATVKEEKPYLVENARANASIFRADSPINQVKIAPAQEIVAEAEVEEEENDDLRPTITTRQYQTVGVAQPEQHVKSTIAVASQSAIVIGKKERIIIGAVIAVILALLTLVIANSAIIANLNSELAVLENSLFDVQGLFADVSGQIEGALDMTNVIDFANASGMIIK